MLFITFVPRDESNTLNEVGTIVTSYLNIKL